MRLKLLDKTLLILIIAAQIVVWTFEEYLIGNVNTLEQIIALPFYLLINKLIIFLFFRILKIKNLKAIMVIDMIISVALYLIYFFLQSFKEILSGIPLEFLTFPANKSLIAIILAITNTFYFSQKANH